MEWLRNDSQHDRCYTYGMAGDIPVVGDWNGNGVSKIGVFRSGNWYLDYNGDGQWSGCGTTSNGSLLLIWDGGRHSGCRGLEWKRHIQNRGFQKRDVVFRL